MASADGGEGAGQDPRISNLGTAEAGPSTSAPPQEESQQAGRTCPWKTSQHYNNECSRYYDCPSHVVERAVPGQDVSLEDGEEEVEHEEEVDDEEDASRGGPADEGTGSEADDVEGEEEEEEEEEEEDDDDEHERDDDETASEHSSSRHGTIPEELRRPDSAIPRSPSISSPSGTSLSGPSSPSRFRLAPFQGFLRADDGGRPSGEAVAAAPASTAQQTSPQATPAPGSARPGISGTRQPSEIVLPRWQPDAEVTLCPICGTQFSIFVRKHHCRKCGRVVCGSCSPHRILIPYQYVVHPPGTPGAAAQRERYLASSLSGGDGSGGGDQNDPSRLVGGERVRLCNPCVPDPNTAPPQAAGSALPPRPSPAIMSPPAPMDPRMRAYLAFQRQSEIIARARSASHSSVASSSQAATANLLAASAANRYGGTPPSYFPFSFTYSSPSSSNHSSNAAGSSRANRTLPPTPRTPAELPRAPPIPEEDECPVCHRELPARTLPNFERLREAHIDLCITTHSTYGSPRAGASPSSAPGREPPLPPPPPRRTGMFPYLATEKDCVDAAECTICLEEFEVGVPMARLECLCRFHRTCIAAWFVNHPGRCPVHQHDGFGY